jgi:uncharacterized protein
LFFKKTKILEAQIDDFLDAVSEGALVFNKAIHDYLADDRDRFNANVATIGELENRADELRRTIERQLYTHSLIPESRGDVLGLLENMDDVINTAKLTLNIFQVEHPAIPRETHKDWRDLADTALNTSESVVLAARSFFRDAHTVSDHLHKVYFHEKEGDNLALELKRKIFASDMDLALKMHLRDCVLRIDMVSDAAEDVGDRLSIYAIKRTV